MSEDDRLKNIEKILDEHGETLKVIEATLSGIKVQDERINNMQAQLNAVWKKYDALCNPEGLVSRITNFQASCPRKQIKWIWVTLIPISFTLVAIGIGILSKM